VSNLESLYDDDDDYLCFFDKFVQKVAIFWKTNATYMHPFTYVSTYVMAECNLRKNTTYSPFFTAKILKINKIITSIPDRQLVRACHRRLPRGSRRRRQGPI
jgi:hypothetical protein